MNSATTLSLNMGQMMALAGYKVKAGKPGSLAGNGNSAKFSRLCEFRLVGQDAWAMTEDRPITIRDLYPHMTEEELAVAEANLKRYVAVIVRIYDRLQAEGRSWPKPVDRADLTLSSDESNIRDERSNSP